MKIVKSAKPKLSLPTPKGYVIDSHGTVHFFSNNQSRIRMMRDLKENQ